MTGNANILLQFKQLVYGYERQHPIGRIDGSYAGNNLLALLGSNGSGKSTLLKTIMGIIPALDGKIIYPHDIKCKHKLSYLSQHADFTLDFPISVADFVMSGFISKRGLFSSINAEDREQAYHALEIVQLIDKKNNNIGELSGGQMQRTMFARLLLEDNDIILMDEPFSGVDTETTILLLDKLTELKQQGKLIIISIHGCHAYQHYFDGAMLIENGQVNDLNVQQLREFLQQHMQEHLTAGTTRNA